MKKTVLRLFVRSAAVFLAFWLLMAGVLSYSNLARMRESVGYANEEVRQRAAYDTQDILAGGAAWEEKGHIAAWRLTFNQLGDYVDTGIPVRHGDGAEPDGHGGDRSERHGYVRPLHPV